ncbi:MAG: hypothetical protein A2W35_04145 [Chloroflexi bacterium RBG_16_57_11]|nr:MAG: hypothetical protein A2W35_04145 [Chloroflexi bacterium RBG_16_57_11]
MRDGIGVAVADGKGVAVGMGVEVAVGGIGVDEAGIGEAVTVDVAVAVAVGGGVGEASHATWVALHPRITIRKSKNSDRRKKILISIRMRYREGEIIYWNPYRAG